MRDLIDNTVAFLKDLPMDESPDSEDQSIVVEKILPSSIDDKLGVISLISKDLGKLQMSRRSVERNISADTYKVDDREYLDKKLQDKIEGTCVKSEKITLTIELIKFLSFLNSYRKREKRHRLRRSFATPQVR